MSRHCRIVRRPNNPASQRARKWRPGAFGKTADETQRRPSVSYTTGTRDAHAARAAVSTASAKYDYRLRAGRGVCPRAVDHRPRRLPHHLRTRQDRRRLSEDGTAPDQAASRERKPKTNAGAQQYVLADKGATPSRHGVATCRILRRPNGPARQKSRRRKAHHRLELSNHVFFPILEYQSDQSVPTRANITTISISNRSDSTHGRRRVLNPRLE